MTQDVARITVLPREVSSGIIVSAAARSGWAVGATILVLTIAALIEFCSRDGDPLYATVPMLALIVMLAALVFLAARPSIVRMLLYLLVGTCAVGLYQFILLSHHPGMQGDGLYLLNRPAVALLVVGTVGARPLLAVAAGIAGYVLGLLMTVLVATQLGLPVATGSGPTIAIINYSALFLILAAVRATQVSRVPDFGRLRGEMRRLDAHRAVEQRAIAVIHDTVLNDLTAVMNGPEKLTDRARQRLRRDVRALMNLDWAGERGVPSTDPLDVAFRNDLMSVIRDLQWRGLSVELTGIPADGMRLGPNEAAAALGAIRACLENVIDHSGVQSAELVVGATDDVATVMIIDAGAGFDAEGIAADRLGLRASVIARVEEARGSVRVFSALGRGTSVLISLPRQPVTR